MRISRSYLFAILCVVAPAVVDGGAIRFRSSIMDRRGTQITQATIGDTVTLNVSVEDIRDENLGVFSAFLDLEYDASLLRVDSNSFVSGPDFGVASSVDFSTPGVLDEAGSLLDGFSPLGAGEFQLFSVDFEAIAPGAVSFIGSPADILPAHVTTLFGNDNAVSTSAMEFANAQLTINNVPEPTAPFVFVAAGLFLLWRSSTRAAQETATN